MSKGSSARAILVGRMGDAIQVKDLKGDNKVGNIRLATTSGFGDKATTSWHNVVVYDRKKIEVLDSYTEKGSRIFVEGEIRNRQYEKDGVTRTVSEVVVAFDGVVEIIDGRKDETGARHAGGGSSRSQPNPAAVASYDEELDDDVPFISVSNQGVRRGGRVF